MRIFELADKQFAEQQDFAIAIGKKPSVVSQWRMGRTKSYRSCLPKIAEVLGTTTDYLNYGTRPEDEHLTDEERQLLLAYRNADARAREMVKLALEPFGLSDASEEAM